MDDRTRETGMEHGDVPDGDSVSAEAVNAFAARWHRAGGSELANYQLFLTELIALLGLPTPDPAGENTRDNAYVFERSVRFRHGDGSESPGRIDLYRRGAFVCEAKRVRAGAHTRGFDEALLRARSQAESYARALSPSEGRPPFLVVVDVGHIIELYSEFSRSGATYTPFPDPASHRIRITDLHDPAIRARLRQVWLDPLALDPSRIAARVTREIAADLAELAKSLEAAGHDAELVAGFLTRCLFTLFAEDVDLIPRDSFKRLLAECESTPAQFAPLVTDLWCAMDEGAFSVVLRAQLLRFNGKLFKNPHVLALNREQIAALLRAARHDWRHVEPAIFGTLLERALDPRERHKLGAHYTPRAYVERLVLPTVIEPLRGDWKNVQAAALTLMAESKSKDAHAEIRRFHRALCTVRVLDPACGSGNFLYVTLEHLKRLEGEVLNQLAELGETQSLLDLSGVTVDPHQFLGIELNPRAAALAELVLWIGYLQWHFRTRGHVMPPQPVLKDFHNIECRDALLAYDSVEPVYDDHDIPVTRWDGRTTKTHPVTGEQVPDDTARVLLYRYKKPRKAAWPEADFVVGNPPFIGKLKMRDALGDGYIEALRRTWSDVPDSVDLVMYWWHHAGELLQKGKLRQFGLITTKALAQSFNRVVVAELLSAPREPISLRFAIPNHPWVDGSEGAAVRIAMTVGARGRQPGRLCAVTDEQSASEGEVLVALSCSEGMILPDLRIGADVAAASSLQANALISNVGVIPHGDGFLVSPDDRERLEPDLLRTFRNGKDLAGGSPRGVFAIDTYGIGVDVLRRDYPATYQWLWERVKPERDQNPRETRRLNWWLYGENHPRMRDSIRGLSRYIATVLTAKHRTFFFVEGDVLPDQTLVVIGSDDPLILGVLSSRLHVTWALAAGGRLGVGNDPRYNKSRCFETYPFPPLNGVVNASIAHIANEIDRLRWRQRSDHPKLSLTKMYDVLQKLRTADHLSITEAVVHEQGLVSVLRQLHDELDLAVLEAYGWSDLAPLLQIVNGNAPAAEGSSREDAARSFDESILERLVALNAERAAEEKRGRIRWLRPEFQNPDQRNKTTQRELVRESVDVKAKSTSTKATARRPWPKDPTDQVKAVVDLLEASATPLSEYDIATAFIGRGLWRARLPRILEMLTAIGRVHFDVDARSYASA